jgi:hypothetical protein
MRGLLTLPLLAGLICVPLEAQRVAHMGGGFSAPHPVGGFHSASSPAFASAPRSAPFPSPYRLRFPSRFPTAAPYRLPYAFGRNANWYRGGHRPPYRGRGDHDRRTYVPYFYANSTYLVPGLLNAWWDGPYSVDATDSGMELPPENAMQRSADPEPQPEQGTQQRAASNQEYPPPPTAASPPLTLAAVTLVFKDGHTQQVRNYAMTGTTLYVLDDAASTGRRPEIPLSSIDLAATLRVNQQAGVEFTPPGNGSE